MKENSDIVFQRLKDILLPFASGLTVAIDQQGQYSLDAPPSARRKEPLFFGSVAVKKNYVSFYVMPVYVFPDLLDELSPGLKKRMQGKSCFNFTVVDETLFAELAGLVHKGFVRYQAAGYLSAV